MPHIKLVRGLKLDHNREGINLERFCAKKPCGTIGSVLLPFPIIVATTKAIGGL